jgi:hypothetical protein
VEHAQPLPLRPWKTAAVVAAAIAALELAVLLVLAVGALARPVAVEAQRTAVERSLPAVERPAPAEKSATPVLPRGETAVVVLNGNGISGAAAESAAAVKELGYIVGSVGNAPRADYRRSLVMYRPGREGEARRLAADLRVKVVAPLDGLTPAQLLGAHVALVIGAA